MDPLTAWALALKAIAEMITEVVRDQPPEVRAQAWKWWLEDTAWWRKALRLEQAGPREVK